MTPVKQMQKLWALFCVLLTLSGVASAAIIVEPPSAWPSEFDAVRELAERMTQSGALRTPDGARQFVAFVEDALELSAAKIVDGNQLLLNAESVRAASGKLDADAFRRELEAAMERNGQELFWSGSMSVTAGFRLFPPDILVTIQPDIVNVTTVDKILIRTPFYDLSFRPSDLADGLTEDLIIELNDISDSGSDRPVIQVDISRKNLFGYFTLSFPTGDGESMNVVNADGDAPVISDYNEVSEQISGRIRSSGVYHTVENGKRFSDLEGMSAERRKAIQQFVSSRIISGYSDGGFHPENTVTRGQFVKIIMNAVGKIDNSAKPPYSDVTPASYYYHHVATATKLGYITGYPDGTFHGEYLLTRAQICNTLGRILIAERGYSVTAPLSFLSRYDDKIPAYAQESVALLTCLGILDASSGQFHASEPVSRGEVAELIYRMLKYL